MKYYLHDSNSFNDEKITELFIKFGYEGLGLFYTILEKIAAQEKPIKTNVLKSQLKVGKRLEKCWLFMEEIGLIHSPNGETFNKQLLNYNQKYQVKKEKNTKRISEWREKQNIIDNVTCYESVCNAPKLKVDKVNIVNGNTSKSEIPILIPNEKFILSINEEWRPIVKKWLDYKKEKGQQYKGSTSKSTMFEKLKRFSNGNPSKGLEIIENSISNNYSGFFEPKQTNIHPATTIIDENFNAQLNKF